QQVDCVDPIPVGKLFDVGEPHGGGRASAGQKKHRWGAARAAYVDSGCAVLGFELDPGHLDRPFVEDAVVGAVEGGTFGRDGEIGFRLRPHTDSSFSSMYRDTWNNEIVDCPDETVDHRRASGCCIRT